MRARNRCNIIIRARARVRARARFLLAMRDVRFLRDKASKGKNIGPFDREAVISDEVATVASRE